MLKAIKFRAVYASLAGLYFAKTIKKVVWANHLIIVNGLHKRDIPFFNSINNGYSKIYSNALFSPSFFVLHKFLSFLSNPNETE